MTRSLEWPAHPLDTCQHCWHEMARYRIWASDTSAPSDIPEGAAVVVLEECTLCGVFRERYE